MVSGVSERRGWWRLAGFDGGFEHTFEGELDFVSGFLAGIAVRHDARPFDDLGDIAFIALRG